ncbi:MAG: PSD1 and planctomycete cytochrome C domain-containing protein [Verrucomicrobiota bacterium]
MTTRFFQLTGTLVAALTCGISHGEEAVDFSDDIRPILSGRCFNCHGPDAGSREADLRLDIRDAAIEAGGIVPGNPDESLIIERVITKDRYDRMPPKGKALTEGEVDKLRRWIEAGAPYEAHWAYVKPKASAVAEKDGDDTSEASNPIDLFIRQRLEKADLEPAPPADPAVLLRRVSLDIIGLPPTPEEVKRFEKNPSKANYEREVDRLLASKHFGEKWAISWLDLARYADSNGYQHDDLRTMWPYRDWVVNAFNNDMPFDQFTIEQLAGDLLPNPTTSQRIATGFHRNVATNFSGGTKVAEVRAQVLHDRVSTTGQVWLGMTLECAQCHDHKFDPISQKEYYQFYAYFNQAIPEFEQKGVDMFRKFFIGEEVPYYASPADARRAQEIPAEIAHEEAKLDRKKPIALKGQTAWEKSFLAERRAKNVPWERFDAMARRGAQVLNKAPEKRSGDERQQVEALLFYDHPATGPHEKRIDELRAEMERIAPKTMVMMDTAEPMESRLFHRGDYTNPTDLVQPGFPKILHTPDADSPPNRLGLAEWLVHPENPLTARVTVNRLWAEIFGRGIVATPEDFGMQSPSPTHPELLDWLALEFIENDWSMKHLIKTMVLSSTYQQKSKASPELLEIDPANELLARGPRFRQSGELVRDNLLAVSGLLSRKMGGPAVFPVQPDGLWKDISTADVTVYPTSEGEDRHRRGLYTFLRRGNPYPSVLNFDGTNRSTCVVQRGRSNTAVQALNLLNDPVFVEAAEAFATMIEQFPGENCDKVTRAFQRAAARKPSDAELETLLSLYHKHNSWFSVAQVLLNLDETITKS